MSALPRAHAFRVYQRNSIRRGFPKVLQVNYSVNCSGANKIRYDRNSVISAFRHMPNFTYCLNMGCDSGQIHGGGDDQPIMTCTACQFKTCFTHKIAWHSGMTCSEYDEVLAKEERMEQEAASQKFLTKKTKICPNPECGLHCIKASGCDHMTCKFYKCQVSLG